MPGFGFRRDELPDPFIVSWKIADGWGTLAELPGVRIRDGPLMGTIGIALSEESRREMLRREENLRERGGFVFPPEATGAGAAREPIARKGCARFRCARMAAISTSSN